jgi:hypothetical protein
MPQIRAEIYTGKITTPSERSAGRLSSWPCRAENLQVGGAVEYTRSYALSAHVTAQILQGRVMAASGRRNADDSLLVALAAGRTVEEAARQAGLSERTAFRRLAVPGFRQRVAAARAEMVEKALGRMADSMSAAADTLRQLLTANGDNVKLGAARALLELTVKLRESVELEARLQSLETRMSEPQKGFSR